MNQVWCESNILSRSAGTGIKGISGAGVNQITDCKIRLEETEIPYSEKSGMGFLIPFTYSRFKTGKWLIIRMIIWYTERYEE